MMAMMIPGGVEWIFIFFMGMFVYVLPLAFAAFVVVFLLKIHNAVIKLQQKVEQLEQKQSE